MTHSGTIGELEIRSNCDFVVYGPAAGVLAECSDLAEAKAVLQHELARSNQSNVVSDLAIFRWLNEKWSAAISPYEIQEWEIEKNPSRVIRFP